MKVKAKRPFISPVYGNVAKGDEFECSESQAEQMAKVDLIEDYETKVVEEKPKRPQARKAD